MSKSNWIVGLLGIIIVALVASNSFKPNITNGASPDKQSEYAFINSAVGPTTWQSPVILFRGVVSTSIVVDFQMSWSGNLLRYQNNDLFIPISTLPVTLREWSGKYTFIIESYGVGEYGPYILVSWLKK